MHTHQRRMRDGKLQGRVWPSFSQYMYMFKLGKTNP